MPDDTPHFDDAGRLIAPKYDDVYFSAEDGLAETRHVFLEGNRLVQRFSALKGGECFTIGETGFGTGLNFLAAWHCFEQHAPADARLEFVSVEGRPLARETMSKALSPWPELAVQREALLQQWGPIWPGLHRFRFASGRVRLTLLVGEAERVMGGIDAGVDAWFLDGFAPSRNPDMWSDQIFMEAARLSATGATLATYTAAGFVRRGLQTFGFEIEKCPGFGTKRDMTVGHFTGAATEHNDQPDNAVVVGGSLAGSFAARTLAERGLSVQVIEKQPFNHGEIASLAPRVAVLQPKVKDLEHPAGRRLREGYATTERLLRSEPSIARRSGWSECGTFQAAYDAKTERRLRRFNEAFGDTGLCRWIDPDQTEEELGVALTVGGLVIDNAGVLRPAGLCAALLDHERIEVVSGRVVESVGHEGGGWWIVLDNKAVLDSPILVLANAMDASRLRPDGNLLQHVRGQVTMLRAEDQSGRLAKIKRAVFYGGYLTPVVDGLQTLGSTFIHNDTDLRWRDGEHLVVCDRLARLLPEEAGRLSQLSDAAGWVGIRTSPMISSVQHDEEQPGLFYSHKHGSHGIASAASVAEAIACLVTSAPRLRELQAAADLSAAFRI